jgi:creatinine amidohydrolase
LGRRRHLAAGTALTADRTANDDTLRVALRTDGGAAPTRLDAAEATLPEVRAFLASHPYALLHVGATEQHGPHLPLATDTLLAERFVREIARRAGGLVLPSLAFGYSWTWRDVPGTLTLAFDTYLSVMHDLAESAQRSGVRALAIVSGHEANRQPIKYAIRERIADALGLPVIQLFYPGLQALLADADSPAWTGGMLHAEEFETSLMLHHRPDLVRMEAAVRDYPDAPATFGLTVRTMGDLMGTGVFGDATVASVEKGARWLARTADAAAALWIGFLAMHDLRRPPPDEGASA